MRKLTILGMEHDAERFEGLWGSSITNQQQLTDDRSSGRLPKTMQAVDSDLPRLPERLDTIGNSSIDRCHIRKRAGY
jgi:hypothetical protein